MIILRSVSRVINAVLTVVALFGRRAVRGEFLTRVRIAGMTVDEESSSRRDDDNKRETIRKLRQAKTIKSILEEDHRYYLRLIEGEDSLPPISVPTSPPFPPLSKLLMWLC